MKREQDVVQNSREETSQLVVRYFCDFVVFNVICLICTLQRCLTISRRKLNQGTKTNVSSKFFDWTQTSKVKHMRHAPEITDTHTEHVLL